MGPVAAADQRSFFRVRSRIGLCVQRISPERWESEEAAILADRTSADEALEPELARRLERLEHKLDLLLDRLGLADQAPRARLEPRSVLLSGSGLRFDGEESLVEGDLVRLELELEGETAARIRSLGRVSDVRGVEAGGRIEIGFDVIREVDRDRVIESTLEVERRRIRAASGDAAE